MINRDSTLRNNILQLLNSQKLGVLATQSEMYPHTSLVAYAFTKDLKFIIFATLKNSRKFKNIENHPEVSILIDNRKNRTSDFKNAVALTATGIALRPSKLQNIRYRYLYLKSFPDLRGFINDPDSMIIPLKVDKYTYVQQFQEVAELKINKI